MLTYSGAVGLQSSVAGSSSWNRLRRKAPQNESSLQGQTATALCSEDYMPQGTTLLHPTAQSHGWETRSGSRRCEKMWLQGPLYGDNSTTCMQQVQRLKL